METRSEHKNAATNLAWIGNRQRDAHNTDEAKRKIMQPSKALINRIRQELLLKTSDAEKAAIENCKQLGYRVVRQQPITTGRKLYFADIYLPELKVIIEIDGGYHYTNEQKRKDGNRSAGIWRMGYHVVRLSNHDARDIIKVKAKIELVKRKNLL